MNRSSLPRILFEAAERNSAGLAARDSRQSLTYSDLVGRAFRLSRILSELGVARGDRVVICLPKSVEAIVAIYASRLAGACYVPVDVTTPRRRIRWILKRTEAKIAVCRQRLKNTIFGLEAEPVSDPAIIRLSDASIQEETPWSQIELSPENAADTVSPPGLDMGPGAMAYILFTSGSIGVPKGVVHTHGCCLDFVTWASEILDLQSDDLLPQHASFAFDLSVFDIFGAACAAAGVVFVPEWSFGRRASLYTFVAENQISVWYSVPSALMPLTNEDRARAMRDSRLRHAIYAGETLFAGPLLELSEFLPRGCEVWNWYGPTETNVCTFRRVTADDLRAGHAIPIGAPCPYADVRVEPVSEVGAGILLMNSPTTMKQYWREQQLTDNAFTFLSEAAYYKTGDIVESEERGFIFVGRTDRQLKLRGYRIQPEEIECTLLTHEAVSEAAVLVEESRDGARLFAAVAARDKGVGPESLRKHCSERLPHYMVPEVEILPALPRGDE